jgi:hypothetical protein
MVEHIMYLVLKPSGTGWVHPTFLHSCFVGRDVSCAHSNSFVWLDGFRGTGRMSF